MREFKESIDEQGKKTFKPDVRALRNDLIAAAGEFIGTVLFLLLALGAAQTVQMNKSINATTGELSQGSDAERLIAKFYVSAAFGYSLIGNAFIFYRFTGSIFNPCISLALCVIGAISKIRFLCVATAQMLGAIVAPAILMALTPGELNVGTYLSNGTTRSQGVFIEMFITAALTLSVLMLSAEKHVLTPFAPVGFGFILMSVLLCSVEYTGGSVNTARSFGCAVFEGFPTYHWIYWLGPNLGALLATAVYVFLKAIHYWEVNPGQDSTDANDAPLQQIVKRAVRDEAIAEEGRPGMVVGESLRSFRSIS